MPPVPAERLKKEIEWLLKWRDEDVRAGQGLGHFRSSLEKVIGLEKGALEEDKDLITILLQEAMKQERGARSEDIEMEVEGEEADGRGSSWYATRRWILKAEEQRRPLRPLLSQMWSEEHQIPQSALDFDTWVDKKWIPLGEASAQDLGWTGARPLRFFAYPTDPAFAESELGLSTEDHPAEPREWPPPEPTVSLAAVPEEPEVKATKVRKVRKKSKMNLSSVPAGEDDPIEFQQANPKKISAKQGSPYDRYEHYKAAKTMREALHLGAAPGDLKHDFDRGFLRVLR